MRFAFIFMLVLSSRCYSQSANMLSPAQLQHDVAVLRASLTALHSGLYRYMTPAQLDANFSDLVQHCQQPLNETQFYLLLSQFVVHINCGHTYLNPWNQKREVVSRLFSKSYLPFLFSLVNGKIIVTHPLTDNPAISRGDEIVRINGSPGQEIIDSLLTVSRADGNQNTAKRYDNLNIVPVDIDTSSFSLFDCYFPLFFPDNFNAATYVLTVKSYKGAEKKVVVKSMRKAERQHEYEKRYGLVPIHEANWNFRLLNQQTAYLRLGDFETWEWKADYHKYLDSVFTRLHQSSARNLIVDIRGNEGGDDDARDEVISYLIQQPVGCDLPRVKLTRFLTIPDTLLPYLKSWDVAVKKPKLETDFTKTPDGLYRPKESISCQPIKPKANGFQGTVFLLTNATNSSTTFSMADLIQRTKIGTVVGEPTGGTKQGLNGGQFLFLRLPGSNFEIDIPLNWWAPVEPRPDGGITPDHVIRPTQQDVKEGQDVVLKAALALTKP